MVNFFESRCLYCVLDAQAQVSKWGQKEALGKGVEVVVATPGRLIDLMQEGIISLAQVNPANSQY